MGDTLTLEPDSKLDFYMREVSQNVLLACKNGLWERVHRVPAEGQETKPATGTTQALGWHHVW